MGSEKATVNTLSRRSAAVFGTFHLNQSEFTLPVESIQEVVNFPSQITAVPLSPEFLIGIFNLRGIIIPVINMKCLLHFKDPQVSPHHKIAIVDFQGAKVGLLFDSTGEILHIHDEQKSEFEYGDKNSHRAVRGALKLDGGNRIVQILDPSAFLTIENLPQIIDKIDKNNPRVDRETNVRGPRKQCISFQAGKTKLAIEINAIHEIIKLPEIQNSVIADENCLGMANLRGNILPVIDFVKLLGFRGDSARVSSEERIIVMRLGQSIVGLLIDSVDNIVSFYKDEILPIPMVGNSKSEIFSGLISRENTEDMILLSSDGVLANREIKALADGHTKLFGSSNHLTDAKKKTSSQRRVCIAFQLEDGFALPIQQIQEIINYSEETIRPPGLPAQIRGVLNLRGKAVTIVDLRVLYGLAPFPNLLQTKVLIVEHQSAKFGLLVDSVEDIISFFDEQKLEVPQALIRGKGNHFQNEVKEILELAANERHEKKCLMILDLEKVIQRIEAGLKVA